MHLSDENLAHRWRRGDERAAAIVVDRYADAVGAVAFAIVGDFSNAEEVVQETFARASAGIRRLRDPARLGPWLVGIARYAAMELLRKRRREVPLGLHEPAAPDNPAGNAARHEMMGRLREEIRELPEDQRDIFAMKYVAGMSYAQIGQAMGLSPEAVGQKLWRVRQKLQRNLEEFRP